MKAFAIGFEIYDKSAEKYRSDAEKRKKMLQLGGKIDASEMKNYATKDLSLDETLKYVNTMEQTKTEHALQATVALTLKKVTTSLGL